MSRAWILAEPRTPASDPHPEEPCEAGRLEGRGRGARGKSIGERSDAVLRTATGNILRDARLRSSSYAGLLRMRIELGVCELFDNRTRVLRPRRLAVNVGHRLAPRWLAGGAVGVACGDVGVVGDQRRPVGAEQAERV